MKEKIHALIENSYIVANATLYNPEGAIIFLTNASDPEYLTLETEINELIQYLVKLDEKQNDALEKTVYSLVIAINLMLYFYKTEKADYSGNDKQSYFANKMDKYYKALMQYDCDNTLKARLHNLMGYAKNLTQCFVSAARYYEKAIQFERAALTENMEAHLREYFVELSSAYLNSGNNAYEQPAPGLAEKNYQATINTVNRSFEQPTSQKQNILWFFYARAKHGLATLAQDDANYKEAIDLHIEAISGGIHGLKTDMNSLDQIEMFLTHIKDCATAIKGILMQKKAFSTLNQEKVMHENILFVNNYLATHQLESKFIALKKLMTLAEKRIPFKSYESSSFWQPSSQEEENNDEKQIEGCDFLSKQPVFNENLKI